MESPDPYLSRLAISKAAFMERDVASKEIGRVRATVGIGAGGLYQGRIRKDFQKEISFTLSARFIL